MPLQGLVLVNARELVNAIAELKPSYGPVEQLRVALLLSIQNAEQLDALADRDELSRQCAELSLHLTATTDQHAAVAGELDALAQDSPCEFTPDHVWSLVRAIKVQTRILTLYTG